MRVGKVRGSRGGLLWSGSLRECDVCVGRSLMQRYVLNTHLNVRDNKTLPMDRRELWEGTETMAIF